MAEYRDAYAAVIADLKRRRDELDAMIAQLEAVAIGTHSAPIEPSGGTGRSAKPHATERTHNDFLGMSIVDAAKILMGKRRTPMSPAEIVAGLEAGGLILSSGNKANVVGSVLNRRSKQVGDVVSPKRGRWALKEWYPNRNFGKRDTEREGEKGGAEKQGDATVDPDADVTSEPEQLFAPPQIVALRSAE